MPGLWENWSENDTKFQSFTIIMSDANDVFGELHDRLPVILDPAEEKRWLKENGEDDIPGLLDPLPDDQIQCYEMSKTVNNSTKEGPDIIGPIGSEQAGLDAFWAITT